ncbi:MAG: hypothetical protein SO484_05140 [Bacilli bacterium]|nr:hypothetical protein [Mycoplasma sp.]MDY4619366.1 hypothetical protein [Bacilli bacterium]
MSKRKKKMTGYKKSLLIWFLLLLIASEACLIYVSTTLKMYEKGNIEGYMTSLIKDMKTASKVGNINKYLSYNKVESKYEKNSSFEEGYKELFNESKLSYKKNDKENTYDIYADDTMIASVTLDSKKVRRLGILSFEEYSIKEIETYSKNGIYNIDVYVNSNYDLYINDVKVSDDDLLSKEEIKEYSEVYNKVDLPYENHYKITNLTKKPKIKVMNGNNEVKVTNEKSNYYGVTYFKTDDKDAAFEKLTNKDYDPLTFAKNWSLFLTADLPGERYGLYTLTPNLVEGTALYKRAYSWATNVDITFTSMHTLDKDTFTNVKMNGFTVYNENAFSVDIYLEKNMTLVNGEKRVDTLNDTFYYAYIDGAYRLITMKSKGDN